MTRRSLSSFVFRTWASLHDRPLTLGQLRPLWLEARRFIQAHAALSQTGLAGSATPSINHRPPRPLQGCWACGYGSIVVDQALAVGETSPNRDERRTALRC